jgi:histidinol-phosphate aminotransferase
MNVDFNFLVPDYIKGFTAYIPSKPDDYIKQMFKVNHFYRLNNNENFLGPVSGAADLIHQLEQGVIPAYPSGDSFSLREKLAERFEKSPGQFLIGNGSNELITSIVKAFCEKGNNIIAADKTYAVYEWVAQYSGFEARLVKLDDKHQLSPERVLEAIDSNTKIIFLCNPNNPTGKYWNKEQLEGFLQKVNNRCIVVIDEAYFEYVDKKDYPDGMHVLNNHPNVVVFRTFSKMYGLASLRIGYLCAQPNLIHIIEKTHIKYSVNVLAQLTAWQSMHQDEELIQRSQEAVAKGKTMLLNCVNDLGFNHVGDQGNYWMIELPTSDMIVYKKLMRKGFAVRPMTAFRFPNWIRVSIAEESIMQKFTETFKALF